MSSRSFLLSGLDSTTEFLASKYSLSNSLRVGLQEAAKTINISSKKLRFKSCKKFGLKLRNIILVWPLEAKL